MNKYIVRTSLVWLAALGIGASIYFGKSCWIGKQTATPSSVQPVAIGPPAAASQTAVIARSSTGDPSPLAPVQLTPERLQSIGVTTALVERKAVNGEIHATGTVDIDQRLVSYVQVRFSGYIRKVFANAIYQRVRKGDPLFTIYSPQLAATEKEYVLALRNQKLLAGSNVDGVAAGAAALVAGAEQRLLQWEVPTSEIAAVKETWKTSGAPVVRSPVSGYITERNALPNLYVEPATRLYTIADLSRVWVYAQVFQDDVGRLKPGDNAAITVDAYPGRVIHGRIEGILPQVDMATRTARVRLEIQNPDLRLKPGMFVNVDLQFSLGRHLVVPASAVLQTGTRQLAFLDLGGGRLQPRDVVTGPRAGDSLIIVKGLEAGQRIVTSANFLIDSESQLQAAAGSYAPPPPGAGGVAAQPAQAERVDVQFTTVPDPPHKGNNVFRVKLTDAAGSPVAGALVSVAFYMPAMPAMGMAAMTNKFELHDSGSGAYDGSGVLQSGGLWQVTITAQKNGQRLAVKQLHVNAAGGM